MANVDYSWIKSGPAQVFAQAGDLPIALHVVRPRHQIHVHFGFVRIGQKFSNCQRDHRPVSRRNPEPDISEAVHIGEAVLHARRHPRSHIAPISFELLNCQKSGISVLFYCRTGSLVAVV